MDKKSANMVLLVRKDMQRLFHCTCLWMVYLERKQKTFFEDFGSEVIVRSGSLATIIRIIIINIIPMATLH